MYIHLTAEEYVTHVYLISFRKLDRGMVRGGGGGGDGDGGGGAGEGDARRVYIFAISHISDERNSASE
jgi:hypothetical protein